MFTALQDSVIELVARGERGVPGTPGDYDYETTTAAAAQNIPAIRKTIRVGGRYNLLDKGTSIWAKVAVQPTHPAKFQSLDGAWWELNEPFPNIRQFGARGDGVVDDTNAIQDAFDYAVAKSCMVQISKGNYLVGPLYFNGRAWRDAPSVAGAQPSARGLIGEGLVLFGARFVAKAGAYSSGQAVLTARNMTNKVITGLHIDCAFNADVGLDAEWVGTIDGNPGSVAPACGNTFSNIIVENALVLGINFDQAGDCLIQNVVYRGGTPPVGMSLRLPGGGIWANNVKVYRGRIELSCQNAALSDCIIAGGLRLMDEAFNSIDIRACQIFQDPETGWSVHSAVPAPALGTEAIHFTACEFIGGNTHTFYFAGRWYTGCKLIACHFEKATTTFFDIGNWSAGGGVTRPPIFDFQNCTFRGGGTAFPLSVAGQVLVGTYACTRPDGLVIARRDFPSDIQVGTGLIQADKANLTANGFFGRGQAAAAPPTDSYFGLGYNRSGALGETELTMRGDLWRLVTYDGATFSTRLTFNAGTSNGFYPGTDNVRNLGIASNRWATVYAGSSTIQTSDARVKTTVAPFSSAELAAATAMGREIGIFRFLDAMQAKGEDARFHCGMTVQRAIEILTGEGLDPFAYGFICYDEWDEEVIDYPASYDEDGAEIQPAYREVLRAAGSVYSFRQDELGMFITRGLEQRLAALEEALGATVSPTEPEAPAATEPPSV